MLVIGGGNSACDIAAEGARVGASCQISLRRGYWFLPKTLLGRPLVEVIRWWMPVPLQRLALRMALKVIVGDYEQYGLPRPQHRIFEAHPEFAFALMNGGAPLAEPKKTRAGRRRRVELLCRHGLGAAAKAVRSFARRDAAPDDILDAAALARTALRILRGEAVRFPARPPRDPRGLRMEIWG